VLIMYESSLDSISPRDSPLSTMASHVEAKRVARVFQKSTCDIKAAGVYLVGKGISRNSLLVSELLSKLFSFIIVLEHPLVARREAALSFGGVLMGHVG
jgi:hypothetical protein